MALSIKVSDPQLDAVFQAVLTEMRRIEALASRKIQLGPGLLSPMGTASEIIIQTDGKARGGSSGSDTIWLASAGSAGKVVFRAGTIGGVLAGNHGAEITFPGTPYFVYATVSLTNGGVSSWTLAVDDNPTLAAYPVTVDAPASSLDILLGFGTGASVQWAWSGNIGVQCQVEWRTPLISGVVPYTLYWSVKPYAL